MKNRTGKECPAVAERARRIMRAVAADITDEDEKDFDDSVELSAIALMLANAWCVSKSIEHDNDLLNGLGHAIAQAMAAYTEEYLNVPRN